MGLHAHRLLGSLRNREAVFGLGIRKPYAILSGTERTGPAMPSPAVVSWESHLMFFGFQAFSPGKYKGRIQRRDRLR